MIRLSEELSKAVGTWLRERAKIENEKANQSFRMGCDRTGAEHLSKERALIEAAEVAEMWWS